MDNPRGTKRRCQWEESRQSSILNYFSKVRPTHNFSNPLRNRNTCVLTTSSTESRRETASTQTSTTAPTAASLSSSLTTSTNKCLPSSTRKKKTQLYLDFGQRDFGKQIVCPICNMLYVHGVAEDWKEHESICKEYRDGVSFQIRNARVVWEYPGGANDKIVEIRPSDGLALRQKVTAAMQIVDQELGFVQDGATRVPKTTFLYVRKKRIMGLASVEIIQQAYHLLENGRSTQPVKAMLGIHKLWTHSKARKQGLATRLIDAARKGMVFATVVPHRFVAFSSPTEAGGQFARKYAQRSCAKDESPTKVLVYDLH